MSFSYKTISIFFVALILFCFYLYRTYGTASTPDYTVMRKEKTTEIRAYGPLVYAETIVEEELDKALNKGFLILASYIFAKERNTEKIEMTSPVLFQEMESQKKWRIRFILPKRFLNTLPPKPVNKKINIVYEEAHTMATINVPGAPDYATWKKYETKIDSVLQNSQLSCESSWFARYDAPWIPSFMRRNEILRLISKKG